MNDNELPLVPLPTGLSDEAAAQLLEWLHETARVLESHYAGQLHRYYARPAPLDTPAASSDEPPF
jgi:hypothetical protein